LTVPRLPTGIGLDQGCFGDDRAKRRAGGGFTLTGGNLPENLLSKRR